MKNNNNFFLNPHKFQVYELNEKKSFLNFFL